ncbi:unnamed protein product [Danaus chrysippus]|uniref:(African queen) hypothetical protein n=1 Tax=Danaus chrysippus TaxID=151541 RepID=A0A8J2QZK8_9NEOP|nr:unnamed protein product [Danaus chrysippus]
MDGYLNSSLEEKTIYDIYRACRLCGAGAGYKMPIMQNVVHLDSSEVHQEDKMPPLICELCVDKVNDFYEFLEMCRQTNKRTRLRLGLPPQTMPRGAPDAGDCILGVTEPVYLNEDSNESLLKPRERNFKGRLKKEHESNKKVSKSKDSRKLLRQETPPRHRASKRGLNENVALSTLQMGSNKRSGMMPKSILRNEEIKVEEDCSPSRSKKSRDSKDTPATKRVKIVDSKSSRPANKMDFKCTTCKAQFTSRRSLDRHTRTHTQNHKKASKTFSCSKCKKDFPNKSTMDKHKCTGPPRYNCSLCGRSINNANNLAAHERACRNKKEFKISPVLMKKLKPVRIQLQRCDPLLERRRGERFDVSSVQENFGLAKNCIYPYLRRSIKTEPPYMVNIHQDIDEFDLNQEYVHWDSDSTESDTEMKHTVSSLTALTLRTIFSDKFIGKVPKRKRRIRKTSDSNFDSEKLGIDSIINSLDKRDDDSLFGDEKVDVITNDDFDSLLTDHESQSVVKEQSRLDDLSNKDIGNISHDSIDAEMKSNEDINHTGLESDLSHNQTTEDLRPCDVNSDSRSEITTDKSVDCEDNNTVCGDSVSDTQVNDNDTRTNDKDTIVHDNDTGDSETRAHDNNTLVNDNDMSVNDNTKRSEKTRDNNTLHNDMSATDNVTRDYDKRDNSTPVNDNDMSFNGNDTRDDDTRKNDTPINDNDMDDENVDITIEKEEEKFLINIELSINNDKDDDKDEQTDLYDGEVIEDIDDKKLMQALNEQLGEDGDKDDSTEDKVNNDLGSIPSGSPLYVFGFGIQLEGLIDLGPKWNYKYKLFPIGKDFDDIKKTYLEGRKDNDEKNTENEKRIKIMMKDLKLDEKGLEIEMGQDIRTPGVVTKYDRSQTKQLNDDENKQQKQKNATEIDVFKENLQEFLKHIIDKAVRVWDDIARLADGEKLQRKVNEMKKNYIQQFGGFVKQSENHKLRTKLSSQKFILNTIDTSNRIMQRLVNYLATNGNFARTLNIFNLEIDREKQLEYLFACKKFGVCRSRKEFSDLMVEILDIILQADNFKLQQAANAITESFKSTDFTLTIEDSTQKDIRKVIQRIELWGPLELRAMFSVLKNALVHKNEPFIVFQNKDLQIINKTTAFQEIVDTLDKNILLSDNAVQFDKVIDKLTKWREGSGSEVQGAFESLVKMIKNGLEKLDSKTAEDVDKNFKVLLKPLRL